MAMGTDIDVDVDVGEEQSAGYLMGFDHRIFAMLASGYALTKKHYGTVLMQHRCSAASPRLAFCFVFYGCFVYVRALCVLCVRFMYALCALFSLCVRVYV